MKKLFIILLLIISHIIISQTTSDYKLPPPKQVQSINVMGINGTCASPNGNMNSISSPPPNYTWLQTNGYCRPSGTYGSSGTVCWNFTPTSTSITINSGYSSTGCASINFGPFTLYRCSPSCAVVGSGLSFSVTAGQCYTWCMSYNGNGPGCVFSDFCPYYQQMTPLPIELSYFAGSNQGDVNVIQWNTITEKNNDYFVLENSMDALNWIELSRIDGVGNSNHLSTYSYQHKNFNKQINYYRLKQVDFDGTYKYNGIVAVDNTKDKNIKIIRILNVLGQETTEDYNGIKIIYYSDGSVMKQH